MIKAATLISLYLIFTTFCGKQVGDVESVAESWNFLKIRGPPEPPTAVQVSGDCTAISPLNIVVSWKKGEDLDAGTREFFIEFSTNSSSRLDRWFGGQGDELMPELRISANPGSKVIL